ncbi:unnamed protein product [Absidia cylindrospora]
MEDHELIRVANCCYAITTRYSSYGDGRGSHMIPLAELADIFANDYPRLFYDMDAEGISLRSVLSTVRRQNLLEGRWCFVLEHRHKIERMELWSDLLDNPHCYHPRAYFFCVFPTSRNWQQEQERQRQLLQQQEQERQRQQQQEQERQRQQQQEQERQRQQQQEQERQRQRRLQQQKTWDSLDQKQRELVLEITQNGYDLCRVLEEVKKQLEEEEQLHTLRARPIIQQSNGQSSTNRRRLQLDEEVEEIYQELLPGKAIKDNHLLLKRRLERLLSDYWWPHEKYRIGEFGSLANGLLLDDSDLDLTIILPNHQRNMDQYVEELKMSNDNHGSGTIFDLCGLAAKLDDIGMQDVKVVKAVVPICKFYDPFTRIHGDLSVLNTLAIENSNLIKEYTRVDHRVRPFMYIVKHFVKRRNINDSTHGTFNSYTYIIMCLYYLMNLGKPVIPNLQQMACTSPSCAGRRPNKQYFLYRNKSICLDVFYHNCVNRTDRRLRGDPRHNTPWHSNNNASLSTLLIGFFEFYGTLATDHLIRLKTPSNPKINPTPKGKSLTVVDPFLESKNTANSSTEMGWARIKREFRRAANMLNNGGSFEQVLEQYQSVEYYDPDCIKNRHSSRAWV